MPIRVTIFEDNKKYRESLAVLIDGSPGFTLAGAYPDANDVVNKITESEPDVLLMDIEMPGTSGIEALLDIKKHFPKLNVLMETVFEEDDKIFDSICNGASGYVLKNTPPARILDAIVETYQGGAPMSPVIAKKVLQLLQDKSKTPELKPTENFDLTPREKEILALMVSGMSYKMIAADRSITFETVRSHIRNIYEKLHVATMTEAVAKAIKSNIA
ncbi:MAG: response regulator transcription factor [Bacteroidia bacterium]